MRMNELNSKIDSLTGVISKYSFFTGVTIQRSGENTFQISFYELNPSDLDYICEIDVTLFNDTFLVSEMKPRVKDYYDFVQYLSVYRDLKTFIRLARKAFIEHFASRTEN